MSYRFIFVIQENKRKRQQIRALRDSKKEANQAHVWGEGTRKSKENP